MDNQDIWNLNNENQESNPQNIYELGNKKTGLSTTAKVIIVVVVLAIVVAIIIIIIISNNQTSSNSSNNNNNTNSTNSVTNTSALLATSFNNNQLIYIYNYESGWLLAMSGGGNPGYVYQVNYGQSEELGNIANNLYNLFWVASGAVNGRGLDTKLNQVALLGVPTNAFIQATFGASFNPNDSAAITSQNSNNLLTFGVGPANTTNPPTIFIIANTTGDYILYFSKSQNLLTSMVTPTNLSDVPPNAQWVIIPIYTTATFFNPGFQIL